MVQAKHIAAVLIAACLSGCGYLDGADAAKARALVEQAIAGAVTIKAAH
jgi:hypothetical protein